MDLKTFLAALLEGRIRYRRRNEAVTIGTTASLLLPANPKRSGYRFSHQSANRLHFASDAGVANTTGDEVSRGTIIIEDFLPQAGGNGLAIQEEVWAAFETGAGTVYVTEYEVEP